MHLIRTPGRHISHAIEEMKWLKCNSIIFIRTILFSFFPRNKRKIRITIHQKLTYFKENTEWNFHISPRIADFFYEFKIVIDMASIKDVIREGISFETKTKFAFLTIVSSELFSRDRLKTSDSFVETSFVTKARCYIQQKALGNYFF